METSLPTEQGVPGLNSIPGSTVGFLSLSKKYSTVYADWIIGQGRSSNCASVPIYCLYRLQLQRIDFKSLVIKENEHKRKKVKLVCDLPTVLVYKVYRTALNWTYGMLYGL